MSVKKYLKGCFMSSNEPIEIHEIIGDGVYQFQTHQRMMWNASPIHYRCYDWLKEAYPEIHKEYIAVMEVSK